MIAGWIEHLRGLRTLPAEFDFSGRRAEIAAAYARAPMSDPAAAEHWDRLAAHSVEVAERIAADLSVQVVRAAEPYACAESMFADIETGRFKVSRANSEHPRWDVATNVAFRTVHDVLGHFGARAGWGLLAGFGWAGEVAACGAHFALLQRGHGDVFADWAAAPALFTECLGQTGYAIHYGHFGPQKTTYLPIGA